MLVRQDRVSQLKNFFGFYNLTNFEASIIGHFVKAVSNEEAEIIRSQFATFNKVNRIVDWNGDDRLKYGFTDFYYARFGQPRRVARLLPGLEKVQEKKVYGCRVTDEQRNDIDVACIAVRGQLFEFQYRSANRVWYPVGRYDFHQSDVKS